ncbi:hypothetical protein M0R04_12725 [Candidatus Dojkabacteria bacterium]|jgi:hypothetical protein|nr:hypothetical protein [Candidatus Dojkabacteria bacterium]
MKLNKKVGVSFKIYPEKNKKKYYKVIITQTKEQMYFVNDEISRIQKLEKIKHNYIAICRSYEHTDKKFKGQIGTILFYVESSRKVGIVSHEMTHAVIYYFCGKGYKLKNIRKNKKLEEKFCNYSMFLNAHYWNNWYKVTEKK